MTGEEGWGLAPPAPHGGGGLQAVALLACDCPSGSARGRRDGWVASRALIGQVRKQASVVKGRGPGV